MEKMPDYAFGISNTIRRNLNMARPMCSMLV